jgi:hypothetical protein
MRAFRVKEKFKFLRSVSYKQIKENKTAEIQKLREVFQQQRFSTQLENGIKSFLFS